MLPDRITLVEVGPRDGLQSEPDVMPTATKIEFIRRLVDAGLKRLEVASFVNPKRVPQMADAEAVLAGMPHRDDVTTIGLVLNRKGLERALAAAVDEIGFVVVASDTFNRRNQGVSSEESLAVWRQVADEARVAGVAANLMISAAWGCPFEGRVDPQRVLDLARRALEAQPAELALADTIGVATPWAVRSLVEATVDLTGGLPVRCHFHDTRNTGIANACAAIEAGATRLDASTGGIGGCPFAPAATGNVATEDLLYVLGEAGIDSGVDLESILATARWLGEVMGRPVPSRLSRAGGFPRAVNE